MTAVPLLYLYDSNFSGRLGFFSLSGLRVVGSQLSTGLPAQSIAGLKSVT
jgi:hypothetical protein